MTLTTPGGTPASSMIGISASMVSGVVGGGFEHHRAAGGKRRADLAGRHRGREIPRRNEDRNANGLVLHDNAGARRRRARHLRRDCARLLPHSSGRILRHRRLRHANPAAPCRSRHVISFANRSASRMISSNALRRISPRSRGFFAGPAFERAPARRRPPRWHPPASRSRPTRPFSRSPDRSRRSAALSEDFRHLAADIEVGRNIREQIVVHGRPRRPQPRRCQPDSLLRRFRRRRRARRRRAPSRARGRAG